VAPFFIAARAGLKPGATPEDSTAALFMLPEVEY
jgi:hypothetical protein